MGQFIFEQFRKEILEKSKKAKACATRYRAALEATTTVDFMNVVFRNFDWLSDNIFLKIEDIPQKLWDRCQILNCSNNQLVSLPELPKCEVLDCRNNQLVSLPELPQCKVLYCDNNQLVK